MSLSRRLLAIAALIFVIAGGCLAQATGAGGRIPWKFTVVVMDGADMTQQAEIPVKEAVAFVEKHSRFDITVQYISTRLPHAYTTYRVGPDKNRDKVPDEKAFVMMAWNLPNVLIRSLPVSSSYLFLYKLKGRRPAQAGSALGLDFGLMKGGYARTYATIPVDTWWFINTPKMGFKSWAAQIVAHELINTIQGKVEAGPYRCGKLDGKSAQAYKYEAERLAKLTKACYDKLAAVNDLPK